jgi:hypothetical protein
LEAWREMRIIGQSSTSGICADLETEERASGGAVAGYDPTNEMLLFMGNQVLNCALNL